MKLIRTLSTGYRSLAEIIEGLARKKLILGLISAGAVVSGASSMSAAPFLDDFSTDTSANYTFEDSYGIGGSFDVSGGTLNITAAANNTAMVSTTSALPFAVGESLGVDTRPVSGAEGVFLTLGTATGQPGSAGGDGYRWRRDSFGANDDGVRIFAANGDGIIATGVDPNPTEPATLWIDRTASDTFEFYLQTIGGLTRTFITSHTYAALDSVTNMHLGAQAFDGSADDFPFDNLRLVDTASIGDISLSMTVDRDTGGLTLNGDATASVTILAYSISSASGAWDQAGWTTISGNYDALPGNGGTTGDGSVDSDDNWTALTADGVHTDLSEAELDGGNGATLDPGEIVNLSQAGGVWIKNLAETADLTATVLFSNGSTEEVAVEFTGNSGNAFKPGDLNFDDSVDGSDWVIFRDNHLADLSSLTLAQAYQSGDLDNDLDNDVTDFGLFEIAFDADQGEGAFRAMLNSVPEPTSMILLGLGSCLVLVCRRRSGDE